MLVVQIVAAALLFPLLLRDWGSLVRAAAGACIMLILASLLGGESRGAVASADGYLLIWMLTLKLARDLSVATANIASTRIPAEGGIHLLPRYSGGGQRRGFIAKLFGRAGGAASRDGETPTQPSPGIPEEGNASGMSAVGTCGTADALNAPWLRLIFAMLALWTIGGPVLLYLQAEFAGAQNLWPDKSENWRASIAGGLVWSALNRLWNPAFFRWADLPLLSLLILEILFLSKRFLMRQHLAHKLSTGG
jgi:hypothetical protein